MNKEKQSLLHFTSADTAINYILQNKTLRFNSFKNVNDPRESKDWPFKIFCFYEQNYKIFKKELFKELHNYVMNHIFISCFSTVDQNNLFEIDHDLRMWAQYADNHKGVCIVFDKHKLETEIINHTKNFNLFHAPVDYTDEFQASSALDELTNPVHIIGIHFNKFIFQQVLPLAHPFGRPECTDSYMVNLERLDKLGIPKYMEQHIIYYRHPLLFTKKHCWRDEREYRYVIHSFDERPFVDIPISESISAIIIGNDFPIELLKQLITLSKQLSFDVYKLYNKGWKNHLFEIKTPDPEEDIISLISSFPVNFYYEELFSQVCDLKGQNRIIHIESKTGKVSLFD